MTFRAGGVADSPKPGSIEQEVVIELYLLPTTPPYKE
jgi:hypothetical protein